MAADLHPEVTALAASLGAECKWESARGTPFVAQFHFMREGAHLFCEPAWGSKGSLIGLEVFTPVAIDLPAGKTRLTREGGLDRLGKQIGVTSELQTGDPSFDREVFIDSDASNAALAALFAHPELRAALRSLFAISAIEVGFGTVPTLPTAGSCFVRLGIKWASTADHQLVEKIVAGLVRVAAALDNIRMNVADYRGAMSPDHLAPPPSRKARNAGAAMVVVVPGLVSCFVPFGHSLGGHLVLAGYGAALILWLLQGVLLLLILRGRSSSFNVMLGAWAVALLGVLMVAHDVESMNELFDSGRPTRHPAYARFHVAAKGSSYVEVTATWLPDKPTAHTPEDAASLRPSEGDVLVTAIVFPGAFGTPWVSNIERMQQ